MPIKNLIVKGSNWNMGSNFMHFIYLFKYLTNANKLKILDINTHKKIYKSKRLGYHEIKGSILLQNQNKQELLIMDKKILVSKSKSMLRQRIILSMNPKTKFL